MRLVLGKEITQKDEAKNAPTWEKNAITGVGKCLPPGKRT